MKQLIALVLFVLSLSLTAEAQRAPLQGRAYQRTAPAYRGGYRNYGPCYGCGNPYANYRPWLLDPGYYPPVAAYPPYGYGGVGIHLRFGRSSEANEAANETGIVFDLSQIPQEKLALVQNGDVYLNGKGTYGSVKGFTEVPLNLSPKMYNVSIHLPNGEVINRSVVVRKGTVTPVGLYLNGSTNGASAVQARPAYNPAYTQQ